MNVCFFNDISILGGGELWVLNAAAALTRGGHAASIVCPYRSALYGAAVSRGVDVHGHMLGGATPFHEPLFHYLRSRDIDVLYCTVIGRFCEAEVLGAVVRRLNAERGSRQVVLLLKTGLPPLRHLGPAYYGIAAGTEARRLHVVSEDNRRRFAEWFPEAEPFVAVTREGVDLSRFNGAADRRAARRALNLPADARVVTCASRLESQKGQDNLLLATRDLVRKHPEVQVLFAGTGRDYDRLTHLSAHLGLGEHARFLGHVDDMPGLLAATDIFCHPSLVDGLPNAVVEAMAMGKPVVASAVGGVPELVIDNETGMLTRPHDVRQLVQRLSALVDDEPLRARLGVNAANAIRREMDFASLHVRWEETVARELSDARANGHGPARVRIGPPSHYPVLFLLTHLRTGGEETEVALLAKHLDSRRYPVTVATAYPVHEPSPARDRLHGLGIFVDEGCHARGAIDDKADYLRGFIRQHGIRLVVACQDTALAYRVFEQLSPGECRLIEHAGIEQEVGKIPKHFTARLVGVSPAIARAAAPAFGDPTHARYLPSMVDAAEYTLADRGRLREAYGFGDDVIVVFAGRLDAKKGLDHLMDAAAALLPGAPGLRFLVLGPPDAFQPDYASHVFARVQRELPGGRFVIAGARADVANILIASDICVLPARGEGMSHVINEAGAARLAVVAFDDGAAAEQLAGGRAGVLVPAGDGAAFTTALRSLVADADRRARLGSALRDRVLATYATDAIVPQWHALFDEVVRDMRPSRAPRAVRGVAADRLLPFPSEIQIETNTACNATCIMCPYPEVAREMRTGQMEVRGGRMDAGLYDKILDECAGEKTLRRLEPFLNNEPFTDTRIVDLIAQAKRTVPHAMLTVTTNGSLVTPKVTDRLIHTGLDGIWFSFNGATKETYEKIMGLSFDTVKRNIDYLLEVKPASLRVFTNMIDTIPMSGEIADNVRYWQSRGVQSGASPFVNRAGNVANFDELNYRALSAKPSRICELLYYKMYIGYNGDVLLCCMDWRRRVVLGNVRTHSLKEIWHSDHYQHYRRLHEENRADELDLCRDCSYIHQ